MALHDGGTYALANLQPICTPAEWLEAQLATNLVPVTPVVAEYAVAICRASRIVPDVRLGASPRAVIWLIRSAQAHALLLSRSYVVPADVKAVAFGCLAHRILMDEGEESIGQAVELVQGILESTATPRP